MKKIFLVPLGLWAPLFILTSVFPKGGPLNFPIQIKLLVCLPIFLKTYPEIVRKFDWALNHFSETMMVDADGINVFNKLKDSNHHLLTSYTSRGILLALAYVIVYIFQVMLKIPGGDWRSWDHPAGWWFFIVALPYYHYVYLRGLLRVLLWWRLMFVVSGLDLKLRPSHGDGRGGLAFLSTVLAVFAGPALAFSTSAATGAAYLILNNQLSLDGLKTIFGIFFILLFLILIGPLFFFMKPLLRAREIYIHRFGVLSAKQQRLFEERWLRGNDPDESLEVSDFSAITDYGSETSRVHQMGVIPLRFAEVKFLAISIGLPFIPVFCLRIPWKNLLKMILGLL